ncbi:MAG: TetR/AcrR family transcriptional regulator, partial [Chloroflexota bacterium]|nr:TetR/AcrR family transcriptional regulator [Chloroflexota bacterium]
TDSRQLTRRLTGTETRARIIASVAALVEERGAAGLAVSEVMRQAGVSRTAFYRHYSDVYAVVAEILEGIALELREHSGAWLAVPGGPAGLAVIYPNLLDYARAYAKHGRLMSALSDAASVDERVHSIWWDGLIEVYIDATAAAIVRDQAAGSIGADLDPDATAYALTLMGERLSYYLLGRHGRGKPEDYARIATPIWATSLFGVVPADDDPQ